jgi:hypothetical protein
MGKHLPPPPDFAQPPAQWGEESHVREVLGAHGVELEFDHETVDFVHEGTVEEFVGFYEEKFGPVVMAKAALGDDWPACRSDLAAAMEQYDEGSDGQVRIPSAYLLTVGRKAG